MPGVRSRPSGRVSVVGSSGLTPGVRPGGAASGDLPGEPGSEARPGGGSGTLVSGHAVLLRRHGTPLDLHLVATSGPDDAANVSGVDGPIGIFDSGFGGLTVARALVDLLPNEDIIYLGDTARAPYGPRPIAEVRRYALECMDRLVDHGVKALVIACNTASSAVLRDARERYDVPVTEVILPAARRAVQATRNHRVGVVCTAGTAASRSYDDAFAAAPHVALTTAPCPLFVEFVEAGVTGGPDLLAVARDYLRPLQDARIDTLILGCTHYPLLAGLFRYVLGDGVTLVSSADECARETYATLTDAGLIHSVPRPSQRLFLTTGNAEIFAGVGRRLMGGFVDEVHRIRLVGESRPVG